MTFITRAAIEASWGDGDLFGRYAHDVFASEPAASFDPGRYPQYFVWIGRHCLAYRASTRAVNGFGHSRIQVAIQMIMGHETGAIRDYNVDAVPIDDQAERLLIVWSVSSGEIVALTEPEYRSDLGWPMP